MTVPSESEADGHPGNRRERRMLVVEEDDLSRELIAEMVQGSGITVIGARNCQTAVEIARREGLQIDLLLADTNSARPCLQELAGLLGRLHPGMKTLLMSGSFDEGTSLLVNEQPERIFLLKPFTRRALLGKIWEVAGGGGL